MKVARALPLLAALVLGCEEDQDPIRPGGEMPTIARIEVSPPAQMLTICNTGFQLRARAFDRAGAEVPGVVFQWRSSNPSVATVTADGVVALRAPGSATITASVGALAGTAAILGGGRGLAGITITPAVATLRPGESLVPTVTVDTGCPGPARPDLRRYTLRSSDTTVVRVVADSALTALRPGRATVTAAATTDPTITAAIAVTVGSP